MLIHHTKERPDIGIPSKVNKPGKDISDFQKRAALIELLIAFGATKGEATKKVLYMSASEVEAKCAYYGPAMVNQAYAAYEDKYFGGATC